MRKAIRKEVTVGGRFDIFLDSARNVCVNNNSIEITVSNNGSVEIAEYL